MKLPFSFSLKFVFRLLLPGFIVSLGLTPAIQFTLWQLHVNISAEWVVLLTSVVTGWLFVVLDMHIYMALEGRRFWPKSLKNILIRSEENRIRKIKAIIAREEKGHRDRYLEASVELRRFPMNEQGTYNAIAPTRIGNLILAYESYSHRLYGMDSVFYWPRIWLQLDEDHRKEIDDQQAIADSAVYSTVALFLDGMICVVYDVASLVDKKLAELLPEATTLTLLATACFACGYLLYRVSLQSQATFGETFKAAFDSFHEKVSIVAVLEDIKREWPDAIPENTTTREEYQIAWRYLHNYRISLREGIVPAISSSIRDDKPETGGETGEPVTADNQSAQVARPAAGGQ